jgi:hypothetical protein
LCQKLIIQRNWPSEANVRASGASAVQLPARRGGSPCVRIARRFRDAPGASGIAGQKSPAPGGGGGRADEHGSVGGCWRFILDGGFNERQALRIQYMFARAALAVKVTKVIFFGWRRNPSKRRNKADGSAFADAAFYCEPGADNLRLLAHADKAEMVFWQKP